MSLYAVSAALLWLVALAAAVFCAGMLFTGRWPLLPDNGWVLACACVGGGYFLAALATPDWSPFTMVGFFAPFALIAIAAVIMTLRQRGRDANR